MDDTENDHKVTSLLPASEKNKKKKKTKKHEKRRKIKKEKREGGEGGEKLNPPHSPGGEL